MSDDGQADVEASRVATTLLELLQQYLPHSQARTVRRSRLVPLSITNFSTSGIRICGDGTQICNTKVVEICPGDEWNSKELNVKFENTVLFDSNGDPERRCLSTFIDCSRRSVTMEGGLAYWNPSLSAKGGLLVSNCSKLMCCHSLMFHRKSPVRLNE